MAIIGIILAILGIIATVYFGYPYVKKLSRQNKKDLDQAISYQINENKVELSRAKQDIIDANVQAVAQAINHSEAKLERCINKHVSIGSQDRQASSFCKELAEDVRRLQNSASNYDQGLGKAASGDFDGAEAEFNKAIELQLPMLSKCYLQRGNMRFLQKKFKDACMDYSEAIKINPQLDEAWSNKGITLDELGRHQDAIKAYNRAIEINPQDAYAWSNKGKALVELGRHEDAIKALDKAIEINPQLAEAWSNKGITLDELGRHEDAIKALDRAIQINPQNAYAWSNKGNALDVRGKHEDAIKALDKAIEINPQLAEAWSNRGVTLDELGKHKDAIKALDRAIEINPTKRRALVEQRQCSQ